MRDATLTTRELGSKAGVTPETVNRWIAEDRLPGAYKVLGRWRIPVESAEALLAGEEPDGWEERDELEYDEDYGDE